MQAEDSKAALSDFSTCVRFDPEKADAYVNRAELYTSGNQFAKAISDFSEALKINPKDAGSI